MIFELSLVIVVIIVTGLLVIGSFMIGFKLGNEKYIQPAADPDKVAEIEFEEGDPLLGD